MVKNVKQYFLIAAEGTHRTEESKGNYYPKEIFESRIRLFQHYIEEHTSIVFLYCKFSNPISGVTSLLGRFICPKRQMIFMILII